MPWSDVVTHNWVTHCGARQGYGHTIGHSGRSGDVVRRVQGRAGGVGQDDRLERAFWLPHVEVKHVPCLFQEANS